jgi:hypothetical protein
LPDNNFNYGLQGMQVETHSGDLEPEHSFASVDADNVVLIAMKKAETGERWLFVSTSGPGRPAA